MSIFCLIDDKHIPLYRVMWVAATPHFCGAEDCTREGFYEVRLEQGESVIRGVMKSIVYHDEALDMTKGVMQYLDSTMKVAAVPRVATTGLGSASPRRAARR